MLKSAVEQKEPQGTTPCRSLQAERKKDVLTSQRGNKTKRKESELNLAKRISTLLKPPKEKKEKDKENNGSTSSDSSESTSRPNEKKAHEAKSVKKRERRAASSLPPLAPKRDESTAKPPTIHSNTKRDRDKMRDEDIPREMDAKAPRKKKEHCTSKRSTSKPSREKDPPSSREKVKTPDKKNGKKPSQESVIQQLGTPETPKKGKRLSRHKLSTAIDAKEVDSGLKQPKKKSGEDHNAVTRPKLSMVDVKEADSAVHKRKKKSSEEPHGNKKTSCENHTLSKETKESKEKESAEKEKEKESKEKPSKEKEACDEKKKESKEEKDTTPKNSKISEVDSKVQLTPLMSLEDLKLEPEESQTKVVGTISNGKMFCLSKETPLSKNSLKVCCEWIKATVPLDAEKLVKEYKQMRVWVPPKNTFNASNANSILNRYRDVKCFDHSRVTVKWPGIENDYIHANFVSSGSNEKRFICTQGPLHETQHMFWAMIIQYNVKHIIMLCSVCEMAKNKCSSYWPGLVGTSMDFGTGPGSIKVTNQGMRLAIEDQTIRITILQIKYTENSAEQTRTVYHILYEDWPDRGIPKSSHSVLILASIVRQNENPVVVHCSAGIGRTGTFVAIGCMLDQIENSEPLNTLELLRNLRGSRWGAVQTSKQYVFLSKAMIDYLLLADPPRLPDDFVREMRPKMEMLTEDVTMYSVD